jgi:hypothetical protein
MSEMIERLAKALYSEDDPDAWDEAVRIAARFPNEKYLQEEIDETRAKARRAIEAMREPTEKMSKAAWDDGIDQPLVAWHAMIDAALGKVDA